MTAELRALPFPVQVGVRVAPGSVAAAAIERALGVALPLAANTFASADGRDILWLGPDEWLVVAAATSAGAAGTALELALQAAAGAGFAAVTNLSAGRAVLELSGPAAREVLACVCGLDLHPLVFGPGRCAQTLLAAAPVILQQLDAEEGAGPRYRVFVRPSLAAYATEWLRDAIAGVDAERVALS